MEKLNHGEVGGPAHGLIDRAEVGGQRTWEVLRQIPMLYLCVVFLKGFCFDGIFSSVSLKVSGTLNEFLLH